MYVIGYNSIRDSLCRTLLKPNLVLDPYNYPFALSNDLKILLKYVKITVR